MKLTPHQDEKAHDILQLVQGNQFVLLKGSAGVGKTTLTDHLAKQLSGKIVCAAPTNKAVSVIRNKVTAPVDFDTVHRVLNMRMSWDSNGEKVFIPRENPKRPIMQGIRYLFVDEASMVNKDTFGFLKHYGNKQNCKIIFIGDDKQLNPVKEVDSPVFISGLPEVELTEIIRQGPGNPIIDLSRNLNLISTREDNRIGSKGYIFSNENQRVIETLAEVNGTDELKYLAWTNDDINEVNQLVRKKIYGRPNKVELGETLIFDSPYSDDEGNLAYFTNEEIKVETLSTFEREFMFPVASSRITGERKYLKVTLTCYSINAGERNLKRGVLVVHESSQREFKNIFFQMSNASKAKKLEYSDKEKALARFAQIKYNHAITVHKSQGSTYKQTIINVGNLNKNFKRKEKERLFYTGVTRASDLLILFNT